MGGVVGLGFWQSINGCALWELSKSGQFLKTDWDKEVGRNLNWCSCDLTVSTNGFDWSAISSGVYHYRRNVISMSTICIVDCDVTWVIVTSHMVDWDLL